MQPRLRRGGSGGGGGTTPACRHDDGQKAARAGVSGGSGAEEEGPEEVVAVPWSRSCPPGCVPQTEPHTDGPKLQITTVCTKIHPHPCAAFLAAAVVVADRRRPGGTRRMRSSCGTARTHRTDAARPPGAFRMPTESGLPTGEQMDGAIRCHARHGRPGVSGQCGRDAGHGETPSAQAIVWTGKKQGAGVSTG